MKILPGSGYTVSATAGTGTVTVVDDDPTSVTLARQGSGAIDEAGGVVEFTITLGRDMQDGEDVTVPLVVSGSGISDTDYEISLKPGDLSLNRNVSLITTGDYSESQPAVFFDGAFLGGLPVQVATLRFTALDDDDIEGAGETAVLSLGDPISNLDRAPGTGTGTGGTTKTSGFSVVVTDDDTGVKLSETELSIAEPAGSATYTVVLQQAPPIT